MDLKKLRIGAPLSNLKLPSVNPFLDEFVLMRVGGRFLKSGLPDLIAHPVILSY